MFFANWKKSEKCVLSGWSEKSKSSKRSFFVKNGWFFLIFFRSCRLDGLFWKTEKNTFFYGFFWITVIWRDFQNGKKSVKNVHFLVKKVTFLGSFLKTLFKRIWLFFRFFAVFWVFFKKHPKKCVTQKIKNY